MALFSVLGLSALLTHCALTDHYSLASGTGGANANLGGDAPLAGTSAASGAANAGSGGTAGSSGAAPADSCNGACAVGQTCCGSVCANTTTDANNCGVCGQACDAGRSCRASACSAGWLKMSPPPMGFVGRKNAAAVAMGKSVFIWGGQDSTDNVLDTGAIYSPASDTWTAVARGAGSPAARQQATAVWTGSVVIVFGGIDASGNNALNDAAAYDPGTQTWARLGNAATRRAQPIGLWDGNRAVFWGGTLPNNTTPLAGADRLAGMTWTASTSSGDPGALLAPALAFDGSKLYVMGGLLGGSRQAKAFSYSLGSDSWAAIDGNAPLTARSSAFGAWDGSRFLVWGGRDDNSNLAASLHNDGKYLDGGTWSVMSGIGAPSARMLFTRRGGWSFAVRPGVVGIVGGQITVSAFGNGNLATNGGVYDVASSTWVAVADWPSKELHDYGVGVWTGDELVIWSGRDVLQSPAQLGTLTTTGDRAAF